MKISHSGRFASQAPDVAAVTAEPPCTVLAGQLARQLVRVGWLPHNAVPALVKPGQRIVEAVDSPATPGTRKRPGRLPGALAVKRGT